MEISNTSDTTDLSQDIVTITNTSDTDVDATSNDASDSSEAGDAFASFMRTALGGAGKTEVNEEELFAALIEERLNAASPEAAETFRAEQTKYLNSLRRADGYVSVEEAAVKALESTVASGAIDLETAEQINGQAFAAAQLDDDASALFDSFGSENDSTVAVSSMEAALLASRTMMEEIEAGTTSVASRSLDAPLTTTVGGSGAADGAAGSGGPAPSGSQELDGSGGFLWKPVSEGDGKLVVLLPTSLRDMLERVEIHSALPPDASTLLEEGRFTGDEHNGNRPHYRFDKPGAEYGSNINIVAYKTDGEMVTWPISNGADRHD